MFGRTSRVYMEDGPHTACRTCIMGGLQAKKKDDHLKCKFFLA